MTELDANAVHGSISSTMSDAPTVTVLTNIAGAVAVTVDRAAFRASLRLRSAPLPQSVFNLFRRRCDKIRGSASNGKPRQPVHQASANPSSTVEEAEPCYRSAEASAAASARAESVKEGVRKALDEWALQKSRRESLALWRHECSRYGSSSRIGYHANHPSARRPGSRPSSATTVVRPFSASKGQQFEQKPPGSERSPAQTAGPGVDSSEEDEQEHDRSHQRMTRPLSAIPRLGVTHDERSERMNTGLPPRRGISASNKASRAGEGESEHSDSLTRRDGRLSSRPRVSPLREQQQQQQQQRYDLHMGDEQGAGDTFDEIYEDLDEDDGELDNRISIMETRFSTIGRERPSSAVIVNDGTRRVGGEPRSLRSLGSSAVPRSPRRPPCAPAHGSTDGAILEGDGGGLPATGSSGALVIRSRPTSAPPEGTLFDARRYGDPMAALRARRLKLRMSSAGGNNQRCSRARPFGSGGMGDYRQLHQRRRLEGGQIVRDVNTAVSTWNPKSEMRPLSSATTEIVDGGAADADRDVVITDHQLGDAAGSRPSSAAFRRWMDARPSARSAVSAISSARTIGLDDPELLHLQVEMESRRGVPSRSTLDRMNDHYSAVVRKTDVPKMHLAHRGKRGRAKSPRKKGGGRGERSPRKGIPSGGSKSSPRKRESSRGRSRSPGKGNKRNKGKSRPPGRPKSSLSAGHSRSRSRSRSRTTHKVGSTPRMMYQSAQQFMAAHFPCAEAEEASLLAMEQEEECDQAFGALARAGISVSSEVLRRALIIPTDRPLEACLAALPRPFEGLRDGPFPQLAPHWARGLQAPSTSTKTSRIASGAQRGEASAKAMPSEKKKTRRPISARKQGKRSKSPSRRTSPGRAVRVGAGQRRVRAG